MSEFRIEKDSLGEVKVPANALWGAQTQRALENFPVSGIRFPRTFIRSLGLIKAAAAEANSSLGLLDAGLAEAIRRAADEVARGRHDEHFPLDVFQTGSGTSTNMNANEVIAHRANSIAKGAGVHPNDHVNMCQSSNDVIPTAIHMSAYFDVNEKLLPSLRHLESAVRKRAAELQGIVKTGRTHLMDAMPITMGQELGGWAQQVEDSIVRIEAVLPRLGRLALGGTAVGTGINAHPEFAARAIGILAEKEGLPFTETPNHFSAQSSMDTACELSSQLKASATALMKIANDLRWLNSGPVLGPAEITLPALQPGSSIMPGKVNPVICEAMMMVCAQVIGNDTAVSIGNARGNFQLNVMLPLIVHNLLQSVNILANASRILADSAVAGFTVNEERVSELLSLNPILVTSLNPIIGYDRAAEIAKRAYSERRPVIDVAQEMTGMERGELERLLDPRRLAEGGLAGH